VDSAQWVSRVEKSSLLQERMLLSELFQPQIMINALKQQTARTIRRSECTCSEYKDMRCCRRAEDLDGPAASDLQLQQKQTADVREGSRVDRRAAASGRDDGRWRAH
jgi:hypothetical protein